MKMMKVKKTKKEKSLKELDGEEGNGGQEWETVDGKNAGPYISHPTNHHERSPLLHDLFFQIVNIIYILISNLLLNVKDGKDSNNRLFT